MAAEQPATREFDAALHTANAALLTQLRYPPPPPHGSGKTRSHRCWLVASCSTGHRRCLPEAPACRLLSSPRHPSRPWTLAWRAGSGLDSPAEHEAPARTALATRAPRPTAELVTYPCRGFRPSPHSPHRRPSRAATPPHTSSRLLTCAPSSRATRRARTCGKSGPRGRRVDELDDAGRSVRVVPQDGPGTCCRGRRCGTLGSSIRTNPPRRPWISNRPSRTHHHPTTPPPTTRRLSTHRRPTPGC